MIGCPIDRILAFLVLFLPSLVFAGSFRTVPLKVYLDARSKTEVLKIVNEGDEKVTVQIDAKRWTQDEMGMDLYTETKDIVIFPKMADVDKGKERIVRVGYQGQAPTSVEKTYRLFLEELPVTKPGRLALKFALRIGIPIFVKPPNDIREWTIGGLQLSEEILTVHVNNSGNTHVIVGKITATGQDDSGKEVFSRKITGWYALPEISKPFIVRVPREECLKTKIIKVTAEGGKDVRDGSLDVDESMCTPKKEGEKDTEGSILR